MTYQYSNVPQQMSNQFSLDNLHQTLDQIQQPNLQQGQQTGSFPSIQGMAPQGMAPQGMALQEMASHGMVPTHSYAQLTHYFPGQQQQQQPLHPYVQYQGHHPQTPGHTKKKKMQVTHSFDKKTSKLLRELAQSMNALNSGTNPGNNSVNNPVNNPGNNSVNNPIESGCQKSNQNYPHNGAVGQNTTLP